MSFKQQLAQYLAHWRERVPVEHQAVIERHIEQLRAVIARTMLKVGDRAPLFALPDPKGEVIDFGTLLKKGRVIVTFYRGGWCPYCNLELKAFQDVLPEIKAAGASVVAISPEKPNDSLSTAETNALAFDVLTDTGQKVGRAFGLVYEIRGELRGVYQAFGRDIPAYNATPGEWALPVPATYIVDRDGTIIYACANVDYRDRADPREVIAVLTDKVAVA